MQPQSPRELADTLGSVAQRNQTITLVGAASKRLMAGPVEPSDVTISTAGMTQVLQYEPRDLTISVEAGLPYSKLTRLLAKNHQMVPLDPPFSDTATVGGIVASNTSGPRRRLYGTARDLVIGMTFATLQGKLVQSGGMVVKNVAGLDMGKLMIGSFGTLAAIAVVNFKLLPMPAVNATFVIPFRVLVDALAARDQMLKGVLQPAAIDVLNPMAAGQLNRKGYILAVETGGSKAVVERSTRELVAAFPRTLLLEGVEGERFWGQVQNYTAHHLDRFPQGAVVRASCTLSQVKDVMTSFNTAAISRAGSGVCYGYFNRADAAARWIRMATDYGWKAVIEFAPDDIRSNLELWPAPGADFEMMKKVKRMFDPGNLLNRGRLYRLI